MARGVSHVLPVFITAAGGGVLVDVDGNSLIDFGSGIAVASVGNSAPRVADRVRELGLADQDELDEIGRAWLRWADEEDGWFSMIHGEVLCRPR